MVTFLNFNFLLFFILFFPLSYLVSSKYTFLFSFSFFFFTLCFSPPHTYTPLYLHSIFTCIFIFLLQLCLSLYLHRRPHNSHIGKHKPIAINTNTSPLPTIDRKTQTQTHIDAGHEIVEGRGWSCGERKEWSALGWGLVSGNGQKQSVRTE